MIAPPQHTRREDTPDALRAASSVEELLDRSAPIKPATAIHNCRIYTAVNTIRRSDAGLGTPATY
jgi:hypothetical protein